LSTPAAPFTVAFSAANQCGVFWADDPKHVISLVAALPGADDGSQLRLCTPGSTGKPKVPPAVADASREHSARIAKLQSRMASFEDRLAFLAKTSPDEAADFARQIRGIPLPPAGGSSC